MYALVFFYFNISFSDLKKKYISFYNIAHFLDYDFIKKERKKRGFKLV